jgi:phosphate starvation-inducible membrane PsiE
VSVKRKTIRLAKALCIAALAAIAIYAFTRLYVMSQRADLSILLLNVVVFAVIAGVLIYLSKKEKDLEEEEMFRD